MDAVPKPCREAAPASSSLSGSAAHPAPAGAPQSLELEQAGLLLLGGAPKAVPALAASPSFTFSLQVVIHISPTGSQFAQLCLLPTHLSSKKH